MYLSPKQERFVEEYLINLNATEAVKKAGYSHKGASVAGNRLLRDIKIKELIEAKRRAMNEQSTATLENALQILWNDAQKAEKAVDRKGAIDSIARIKGWIKDNTQILQAIFPQVEQAKIIDKPVIDTNSDNTTTNDNKA